ncbi:MAG: trypsin-like peptidase domain-containing protein [Chloroflexota bacterium]
MNDNPTDLQPQTKIRWLSRLQATTIKLRAMWPFGAGIVATFVAVLLYSTLFPNPIPPTMADVEGQIVDILASATPPPAYSAQVYQTILPSLVIIQSKKPKTTDFNEDTTDEEKGGFGLGTGVVVSEAGDILTAFHVVDEADEIEVTFADGGKALAEMIVAEPENDIAVLRPLSAPSLIVPAVLGNPNAMRVGDEAYAVGNPLGLVGSMSEGVISGFDRSLPLPDSDLRLEGLIQFDAAVNPGNSGGPLLNRAGQVVGIVTALANPSDQGFFIGIGFAVPIQTAGGAAGMPGY